uniref:Fucolectin tachylectin-4 pentraxin-1 domain-containing protein n=1 Tax=Neogobius melanostomus TaxID=47308 RepID=A0A8C6TKT8_9GOBI
MKKYVPVLFLLLVKTASASSPQNVALSGKATQIDTYDGLGAASNAIDGNRESIYSRNSCSHTSTTTNPWWRVDLGDIYTITSITIVNRGDCCKERLNGGEIRVGNSLHNNGNDNPIVARISHITTLETFPMSGRVEGRYVNVFLPGKDKYLTLCEVEIYGFKQNVALSGKATQIDTYDGLGAASNAIDGNRESIYSRNSCSHTSTTTNPWWRVDLGDIYTITSITIVNRGDCCKERLNGGEIRVGNSLHNNGNDNPIVARISHITTLETFPMSGRVEGRYVNVFLPGKDKYLTLCEVEIYGFKRK